MRRLKIAVVTEIINYHSGARAPLEIAKNLKSLGNEVTVYTNDKEINHETWENLEKNKVRVVTFRKNKSLIASKIIPDLKLVKALKKEKLDIAIVAAFLPSLFSAKLSGIPILKIYMGTQFGAYLEKKILSEQITLLDYFLNVLGNIYIYISDFLSLHLSNYVVAISKFAAKKADKLFKRKVDKVIYLGGDHLLIPKRKKNSEKRHFHLLSVSRITPYKGFHLLIEALKNLKIKKAAKLTIVGSSSQTKYLAYLKKIDSKNVDILINLDDAKLAELYQNCDVYLTADRYLFFGFPIAEAAFFKKPSIALKFAAAQELIEHGKTGYVAKNLNEFAFYLEKLINSPALTQKMGAAAKKRAEKLFSWEITSKNYNKIFQQILNQS